MKIDDTADCYKLITKIGLPTEKLEKEQRLFTLSIGLQECG